MDLTNREVRISVIGTRHSPPATTVEVDVMEAPADGVRQKVGAYELTFTDETFNGPNDPALMSAIVSKLEAI